MKTRPKLPLLWLKFLAAKLAPAKAKETATAELADAQNAFSVPFPIEFTISQTPVSAQAGNAKAKELWKSTVGRHAQATIDKSTDQYFLDDRPLMATIYYFPPDRMLGDIDNIVKPILDGMISIAYLDDHCIERIVVQKFEPGHPWIFRSPSGELEAAIKMDKPAVYVRLDDDLAWRSPS